jgi:hypothetical protein
MRTSFETRPRLERVLVEFDHWSRYPLKNKRESETEGETTAKTVLRLTCRWTCKLRLRHAEDNELINFALS